MDNGTIKKNLENIRKSMHLSQEDMADALGVARNTYRNIEKGDTRLISDTVLKIAEFADLSPEEVVLGYLPVEDRDRTLQDVREKYSERIRTLTDEYEARLERKREKIAHLDELLKEKDNRIRTLESYVSMLEKRMEEKKND